jgi:microcin C transport system permease protein
MPLNPLTRKRLKRFRSIGRGFWSLIILCVLFLLSLVSELWISNRALVVHYEGKTWFPTYGSIIPGDTFGESYKYETDYRALKERFAKEDKGNWVTMPLIPWDPQDSDFRPGISHPQPPDASRRHWLGTDLTGRDVFARMVYGFRNIFLFSLGYTLFTFLVAIVLGCLMGYLGGITDLLGQRVVEIWSNIPFLYIVMISISLVPADVTTGWRIGLLMAIMVIFDWTTKASYLRTATFKEKSRDYVAAARLSGAGSMRLIFKHILPNTVSTLVTFLPFTVAGGITALTALDFLNFGLPRPTPSWGEMLDTGLGNQDSPWIVLSAFGALVAVLVLVTFVGEAVREAYDPRKFTTYR